jgi:hypothetical protein
VENKMRPAQPIGQFDPATGKWLLTEPYAARLSGGRLLVVSPGFISDGASIPRVLWPLVGPRYNPKTFAPAFAHDALYAAELLPRRECDQEFRRLLIMGGAGYTRAQAYYAAVRSFGWLVWRRHTHMSVDRARMWCGIEGPDV